MYFIWIKIFYFILFYFLLCMLILHVNIISMLILRILVNILLINALFFSHLNIVVQYGVNAVKNCGMKYKNCINFAAKVTNSGKYLKRDHVTPLWRDLKWINFSSILLLNEAFACIKICMFQQIQMWKY